MSIVQELAAFVNRARYEDLSAAAREAVRLHMLDALGCAIGAQKGPPVLAIRDQVEEFGGSPLCSLIGGGKTAPDRAAFYNSALIRYLDFNDSYLAKGETCHPSDCLGGVLAAAEYANASGRQLMTAFAVAYQVWCRLSDEAPVRHKGFDHTAQGAYGVAAGIAKALGLDQEKIANAVAISGTANNALRVTRTGALSNWKGLAAPQMVLGAAQAAFLAMRGITGPQDVFEGNKGFFDSIAGPFQIDWSAEDLERITRCSIKKYNAEMHSQSAIEGLLEMQAMHGFGAGQVDSLQVDIFDVAYHIIGGGEEGGKHLVRNKEEADHSLPYILAVALLDGAIGPAQYEQRRIMMSDVQGLMQRVRVTHEPAFSRRFPLEMPCRLTVTLKDGQVFTLEKSDYQGFFTRPMTWQQVQDKFNQLSEPYAGRPARQAVIEAVEDLENRTAADLARALAAIGGSNV
ncbi:MAG: MmgE/PrpD family protein [Chloroflexi bacterium]|nr:MmgE/PrpD family protein [Chloroflexota bacterium]